MEEKTYVFTKKQLNAEKNKVLSKFASVASHDLKNVVGGISNISYYLSKTVKPESETQKKMLDLLATEVVTLNNRITEVLDMTRVKQLNKSVCDLQNLIIKAIEENKIDGINFEQSLVSVKVYADPERMKQVFSNIIKNAKDAMSNSGTITITMNIEEDKIVTVISDCGKGMNAETLENCFDPMFSTKLAKAVGMGLTVAQQITEMHNGKIDISSQEQKGTSVKITLPTYKED
ncbi:sensor histidine kinase [Candidatus Ruminimicrobiellum ovillum]|uniref:sensor histidine kinase n=1 Tax=Candidatus Ruminimicrobiellum ovillum TaxID=1947927 RepID=UPI00355A204D